MNRLEELLDSEDYVLLDGATGTLLMAAGLDDGAPPEEWNMLYPERVRAVHRAYIEAGSRVILTNTFGGTRFRLKLHNLEERTVELNRAAATLARSVADATPHLVVVAGSMGPTGELLTPMGTMTYADAKAAFAEQATGLAEGGVDVLWVETMSDLNEVKAAIEGARSVSDLPIVATMSYDTHGHTMMGVAPTQALESLRDFDLVATGANCGANLPDTEAAIQAMHQADPGAVLVAKANAGIPRWEGNELVYDGTPEVMAGYACRARRSGARLIGTCCGSSPEHIRAMAAALSDLSPVSDSVASSANGEPADGAVPLKDGDAGSAAGTRRRRRRSRRGL